MGHPSDFLNICWDAKEIGARPKPCPVEIYVALSDAAREPTGAEPAAEPSSVVVAAALSSVAVAAALNNEAVAAPNSAS
jgi:hypothetical protein